MNGAFHIGSVGLSSQQRALDTIANNIANINTPGFKRANMRFSEMIAGAGVAGEQIFGGVGALTDFSLFEQGELQNSGDALDIAISGKGFIEIMGPDGQTFLWRGGRLKVGEDGLLATQDGLALRAAIRVPDDATSLEIGRDGVVSGKLTGSEEAVEFGRIDLVRVDNADALERLDGGLYRVADDARFTAGAPGEDGLGFLAQGSIERSNVDLTVEMVKLMIVQRAYAANAHVVQAADQLAGLANNLRS